VVCVEEVEDLFEGGLSLCILKNADVNADGMVLAKVGCDLNFAMDGVVLLDVTSQKSDDDYGRCRSCIFRKQILDGGFCCY
jgi:hypothetical protein